MKKFKNWTKKPMTWGGYFKLCGASVAVSVLMCLPAYVTMYKNYKAFNDNLNELDDEVTE